MQWSRKAKKYADHEKVCLGMVLKLFDRNFDSPLLPCILAITDHWAGIGV